MNIFFYKKLSLIRNSCLWELQWHYILYFNWWEISWRKFPFDSGVNFLFKIKKNKTPFETFVAGDNWFN